MSKISIKHLKGSKENQVELFELPIGEIIFGRDPASQVAFDPVRDDIVGRSHLKIASNDDGTFTLTDLDSRNGSFVNGVKIMGSTRIDAGDVVQLGSGGPEFLFDLDPRPENVSRSTRIVTTGAAATREQASPSFNTSPPPITQNSSQTNSGKASIGRQTVERLIGQTKTDARRNLINIGAGLIGLIVIIAGFLIYQSKHSQEKIQQQLINTQAQLDQKIDQANSSQKRQIDALQTNAPLSAAVIAQNNSASTVFIESSWKLIEISSGRQLYQKIDCDERDKKSKKCLRRLPRYVLYDNAVEPWLVTDERDEDGPYRPIGSSSYLQTGSGFVVHNEGYILTNRHVAAAWDTQSWDTHGWWDIQGIQPLPGSLHICQGDDCSDKNSKKIKLQANNDTLIDSLLNWVPSKTKTKGGSPVKGKFLEGRNDYLDVTFPKSKLRIPARLVRVSDSTDVALIKIDLPKQVTPVQMDTDNSVQPGDTITVMGYPGISPDVEVKINSQDPLNREGVWRVIPEPSVTNGNVSKVISGSGNLLNNQVSAYFSEMGDVYQLTANATGSGNSGGPVFNDKGKVIGIFTYSRHDKQGTQITFAVPIKYGQEIMGVQSVIK